MLAFQCGHCHKALKVKDELAGKKIRCPQCKQVTTVPAPPAEDATVPPRPIGAVPDDATLPPSPVQSLAAPPPAAILPDDVHDNGEASPAEKRVKTEGYLHIQSEIARGGMGAVMRAVDQDIQREVAVKFLLNAADAKQKARFVEEAQITGQLEHPNIVPIHQLGVHADGRCFFSMKMVKGRSLAEILKDEKSDYTLGKLLTIFVNICNAMAYAHSRGVIHRDLKPANIMVGDFGEVYVMDWGLAKVLGKTEDAAPSTHIQQHPSSSMKKQPGTGPDSKSDSKVATNRATEGDLTQAGSIMGTPAYMPPEQARGESVDERADIYSLGAILYEILTLTPPVGRGGDMMSIVMRVVEGKIDSPEKRAPARAKAGWIPPELSAIALKALALKREDRYQTIEALKRDIDLFLEGRSVSAKHDSAWEMFRKLVRRNKGASIATAAALVVLAVVAGVFLKINYDARVLAENNQALAENNQAAYEKEQKEKERRTREAVPALMQAARLNIERLDPAQAAGQMDLTLLYAPDNAEARLLKAQLLIAGKRFPEGVREMDEYLRVRPQDRDGKTLRELCTVAEPLETANVLQITALFSRQKLGGLAEIMLKELGPSVAEARQQLLEKYRAQIDKGWPGLGRYLTVDNSGLFQLNVLKPGAAIPTLEPLRGIPISVIRLGGTGFAVSDLAPLRGMPLTSLSLASASQVRDLEPLRGMHLETLNLLGANFLDDLSPLEGMPLVNLTLQCQQISDLTPLKGMPLTTLEAGSAKVVDLTPLKGAKLISLRVHINAIRNRDSVAVLREMPTLRSISLNGGISGTFTINDFWKRYDAGEFNMR